MLWLSFLLKGYRFRSCNIKGHNFFRKQLEQTQHRMKECPVLGKCEQTLLSSMLKRTVYLLKEDQTRKMEEKEQYFQIIITIGKGVQIHKVHSAVEVILRD